MPRKVMAVDKKKDVIRLTPVQDRRMEAARRFFKDRCRTQPDLWLRFVGKDRARKLQINLSLPPSRQSLWLVALDGLSVEFRGFRAEEKERASE